MLSPAAWLDEDVDVGAHVVIHAGVRVYAGCTIEDGAVLGKLPKLGPRSDAPPPEPAELVVEEGAVICTHAVLVAGSRVGRGAVIGDHTFVREGARLGPESVVGHGGAIGRGVTVGGRTRLQNNVVVAPGTVIEGDVDMGPNSCTITTAWREDERPAATVLRAGCRIGAGAVLMPGVDIGRRATVGAGSVVRESVGPGQVVVGVPARPLTTPHER